VAETGSQGTRSFPGQQGRKEVITYKGPKKRAKERIMYVSPVFSVN